MDASSTPAADRPANPEAAPPPGTEALAPPVSVGPAAPPPADPAAETPHSGPIDRPGAFEDPGPAGGPGPAVPPTPYAPGFAPPAVHSSRLRRLATPVGIIAAVAVAFAYVGSVDPNEPGHYPVCPLLKLTGLLCPGCGGLRSAHAFIHGDLGAAFSANAVAVVGYFLFAAVWILWLGRAWRGRPLRIAPAPVRWWGVGAVLLIFTVVRNLPFGSVLAP